MLVEARKLTVSEALVVLGEAPVPPSGVLSAFVITSPDRVRRQAYLLSYRAACRGVRSALPGLEVAAFDATAQRVERYLTGGAPLGEPGLAVYAAADGDYLFAVPLPSPPTEHAAWSRRPELDPLVAELDEHERIAVVLFAKERARLFTIFLGDIEERQSIEDEVPGKQSTGGWFALAQTRYARHHEEHVRRHAQQPSPRS